MKFVLQKEIPDEMIAEVFFDVDQEFMPGKVLIGFDDTDKFIGYLSYYRHDPRTIYIQRVAVIDKRAVFARHVPAALEFISKVDPFQYATGAILNTNTGPLREAIRIGFVVHGIRISTTGQIFVLLIKEMGG